MSDLEDTKLVIGQGNPSRIYSSVKYDKWRGKQYRSLMTNMVQSSMKNIVKNRSLWKGLSRLLMGVDTVLLFPSSNPNIFVVMVVHTRVILWIISW